MGNIKPFGHPIFEGEDLEAMAEKTGYSVMTLLGYKFGYRYPGRPFRKLASVMMGRTEEELFKPRPRVPRVGGDRMRR